MKFPDISLIILRSFGNFDVKIWKMGIFFLFVFVVFFYHVTFLWGKNNTANLWLLQIVYDKKLVEIFSKFPDLPKFFPWYFCFKLNSLIFPWFPWSARNPEILTSSFPSWSPKHLTLRLSYRKQNYSNFHQKETILFSPLLKV